jgi:hypothetical protein
MSNYEFLDLCSTGGENSFLCRHMKKVLELLLGKGFEANIAPVEAPPKVQAAAKKR